VPEATPGAGLGCVLALRAANDARSPRPMWPPPAHSLPDVPDTSPMQARAPDASASSRTRRHVGQSVLLQACALVPTAGRGRRDAPDHASSPSVGICQIDDASGASALAAGGPATRSRLGGASTRPGAPTSGASYQRAWTALASASRCCHSRGRRSPAPARACRAGSRSARDYGVVPGSAERAEERHIGTIGHLAAVNCQPQW
jgi:hypothetical protein